jgi:hypothetical protein
LVMNSFSYSYENENMSISQKQSIITLLPKKNNDVRFLKHWNTFIHCWNDSPKLKKERHFKKNFQLIVSNAFSKSIDKTIHERFSSSARSHD